MYKKMKKTAHGVLLLIGLLVFSSCGRIEDDAITKTEETVEIVETRKDKNIYIPIAGNSFLENPLGTVISKNGISNWFNKETEIYTFFKVSKKGRLNVSLKGHVRGDGISTINVIIGDANNFEKTKQEKQVKISGSIIQEYTIGDFDISFAGYLKVVLKGVNKTAVSFANITDIVISGPATLGENIFVNDDKIYNTARKGPISRINYNVSEGKDVNFLYSEVVVPEKEDVTGSIFIVNGFDGGYIQIKAAPENDNNRRISFNVKNPKGSQNIKSNVAGKGVTVEDTSNKLGKRAYLAYNWKTEKTYKFLVKCDPKNDSTDYTAWFLPPDQNDWVLIASFNTTNTTGNHYLRGLYSSLENLNIDTGYMHRKAVYKNIWIRDKQELWSNIHDAEFEVDDLYTQKQRVDTNGGVLENGFFLENGSFFNPTLQPKTIFSVREEKNAPEIDISKLPLLP